MWTAAIQNTEKSGGDNIKMELNRDALLIEDTASGYGG
jgi:hypothetical protein